MRPIRLARKEETGTANLPAAARQSNPLLAVSDSRPAATDIRTAALGDGRASSCVSSAPPREDGREPRAGRALKGNFLLLLHPPSSLSLLSSGAWGACAMA